MTTYTTHYPPVFDIYHVKAAGNYWAFPHAATDPSVSVVGSIALGWGYNNAPQKFNIDHGSAFVASRIYLENAHNSGGDVTRGIKDFLVYGTNSSTAFDNTTSADTTDLTLLGTFQAAQHVASNVADPQYFLITGNTTPYRYTVIRISTDWAGDMIAIRRVEIQSEDVPMDPVSAFLDQQYSIANFCHANLDQVFGLRLGATLDQVYFDAPILQNFLMQPYRDANQLRRSLVQRWGDASRLTGYLEQPITMPEFLQKSLEQKYAITGTALQQVLEEQWNLSQYNLITSQLDQPYIIAPADSLQVSPVITIYLGSQIITSCIHINIEGSRDEDTLSCELGIMGQDEYLAFLAQALDPTDPTPKDNLIITLDSEVFIFKVTPAPSRNRSGPGVESYTVKGLSKAVMLDTPFATPLLQQIAPDMASTVCDDMAALAVVSFSWDINDRYVPLDVLYANDEAPIEIIRKLAAASGAILQSDPDSSLHVRKYYPYPVPQWATESPAFTFRDQDNFFTLNETPETRPGYNKYTISDQLSAQSGVTLEEKQISDTVKEIKAYQVPWDGINRPLIHSGGSWVIIEPMGSWIETIDAEQIEIVNGAGKTSKPIYTMISRDYKQVILGVIQFGEDGTLKTDTPGQSLVELTYQTLYWKFKVTDQQKEAVQCYVEEIIF